MSFMELDITQKGRLVTCECSKCGATNYSHEWADPDFNRNRDAMQSGDARCPECCTGKLDPSTFWESPSRNWYAARYSAPGYLDCTEWNYGKNNRELEREIVSMYGEG